MPTDDSAADQVGANARKVDIVILGSNGRRGWRRLREGSVAERVLRRAAWPVLIVPWDARAGVLDKKRARSASKNATSRSSRSSR